MHINMNSTTALTCSSTILLLKLWTLDGALFTHFKKKSKINLVTLEVSGKFTMKNGTAIFIISNAR